MNKVFEEVENYIAEKTFLEETFTYKDSQIISLRTDLEPFGDYNKIRWFLIFEDVKDSLKKMYNSDDDVNSIFDEKREKEVKWEIK